MTERKTTYGPGPDSKGGGFRGGPKRWTGAGPAPARHIPWPEIFKHHISLIEGHLKMIDMVRKHTVEGTGNYRTIMGCVDRAKEMLQVSKQVSRTFVEPPKQREQVPLGSSSASMYPGYSPADHEYGKAAEEYGKAAAEARAQGIELKHPDAEYQIGQAKGVKRKTLAEIREEKAAKGKASDVGSGSGTGSGSEELVKQKTKRQATTNGKSSTEKVQEAVDSVNAFTAAVSEGENPYFVVDTKPSPVNIPGLPLQPLKRSASPPEPVEAKKNKKAKKKHDGAMPKGEDAPQVKTEDISEQVDARMREKEEKRKMKEKKKRKQDADDGPEQSHLAAEVELPMKKKKKSKKSREEPLPEVSASKKRSGEGDGDAGDGEGRKKKRKKSKEPGVASDA